MHSRSSDLQEYGSDYHWFGFLDGSINGGAPWSNSRLLFGSGRDALRCLLRHGMAHRGWKRLLVPSYFCQEVVESMVSTGIIASLYPSNPLQKHQVYPHVAHDGDVILSMNYFGLQAAPMNKPDWASHVEIIEDHSHDPYSRWAYNSKSDWCIASLRKTLPIPDGGVLWSPLANTLPTQPTLTHTRSEASLKKLAGMYLKAAYLDGAQVQKHDFHALLVTGEEQISKGEVSGMSAWSASLIEQLPVKRWRESRIENHRILNDRLRNVSWLHILNMDDNAEKCPLSAVILFDTESHRNHVRSKLIEDRLYTAILWSLESPILQGIGEEDLALSRRMLSVPIDYRYDSVDTKEIANLIIKRGNEPFSQTDK